MNKIDLAYLGRRMKEASSYAGFATMILATLHIYANPDLVSAALGVVAAVGGLLAVLKPDGGAHETPNATGTDAVRA